MSYTEGPLIYSYDHDDCGYVIHNKDFLGDVAQRVLREDDAKLFCAAPDLFEALDKMLDHFEGNIPLFLFEMAEGAIAKAKGIEQ